MSVEGMLCLRGESCNKLQQLLLFSSVLQLLRKGYVRMEAGPVALRDRVSFFQRPLTVTNVHILYSTMQY